MSVITNCNFESGTPDDRAVLAAYRAVERGLVDDPALEEALEELEGILERDACDPSPDACERCAEGKAAVLAEWTPALRGAAWDARHAGYR